MGKPENKSWHSRTVSEQGNVPIWRSKKGAQPVSDLVSKLLNPVIERRAGMTTDLIASWELIAGGLHAQNSKPEKLIWPKQASDEDAFEPATLVVACESGHAIFLQHDVSAIVGRINTYFGFSAVARIKLTQKPIPRPQLRQKKAKPQLQADKQSNLDSMLDHISDPGLRDALEKMGKGVFSNRSDGEE